MGKISVHDYIKKCIINFFRSYVVLVNVKKKRAKQDCGSSSINKKLFRQKWNTNSVLFKQFIFETKFDI